MNMLVKKTVLPKSNLRAKKLRRKIFPELTTEEKLQISELVSESLSENHLSQRLIKRLKQVLDKKSL